MFDPQSEPRTGPEFLGWLNDQVGALKASLARTQQQGEQTQAALLDLNEKLRDAEGRLREITARTMGLPVMQEQLRQLSGLLDRIQDAEVMIDTKFEMLERTSQEERTRDQSEKNDLYRRVQDLERRTEGMAERQGGMDDSSRRVHEEIARANIQYQSLTQRLDSVETRASRTLDALTRVEQTHGELEGAVRALRREDDAMAERVRLAHEVAARIENDLHERQEEYRELPLIAERVELLRAERQRLEDRVSRAEESLADVAGRVERQEEGDARFDVRLKAHEGRLDQVHASTLEFRRTLNDQLLKLNQMIERMKRRQVEELERDVKDLRVQSKQLKDDEANDF
jgi:chromosome segregation ATPase